MGRFITSDVTKLYDILLLQRVQMSVTLDDESLNHADFQSIRQRASSALTRGYKLFFGVRRGLQVVYKWTSK
jgi:hypothetical protein